MPCSFKRHRGDHAERPFRTHQQTRQVVAGGRLPGAPRRGDRATVGHHRRQRHDVLAHGAVTHRIGSRRPRRRHASNRRVRAGIDRKEQAGVAQMGVQLHAGHASLDRAVQIVGVHRENLVHPRRVDRDPAAWRVHMTFERRADAERNQRHPVLGADLDDLLDLFATVGKCHAVRQLRRDVGRRVAVNPAHVRIRLKPLAEALFQDAKRGGNPLLVALNSDQIGQRHRFLPIWTVRGPCEHIFGQVKCRQLVKLRRPQLQPSRSMP